MADRHQDLAVSVIVTGLGFGAAALWPGMAVAVFAMFYVQALIIFSLGYFITRLSLVQGLIRELRSARLAAILLVAIYPAIETPGASADVAPATAALVSMALIIAGLLSGASDVAAFLRTREVRR